MLPLVLALSLSAADTFPLRALHVRGNHTLSEARILSVTGLKLNQTVGKEQLDAAKEKLLATFLFDTVGFQFGPGPDGQCCIATYDVAEISPLYPVHFDGLPEPDAAVTDFLKDNIPLYQPELPGTRPVIDFYARQIERFLAYRNHAGSVVGSLNQLAKNEYIITFRVNSSLPAVSGVTFSGNKAIDSIKLQNTFNEIAFGQPFTNDAFRLLLVNHVKPLYDALGMIRVKFSNFTTEPDPRYKGVIVHVDIDEGGVYKLDDVKIEGADRDYLYNAKLKIGGIVNFDEVKAAVERIQAQLRKDGYMHALGDSDSKIDDVSKTVGVTLAFDKGDRYTFGTLAIEGLDLKGEPEVRKMWGVQPGKPFNALYPQYFLDRIKENGVFDNLGPTRPVIHVDEKTHVVDVTLIFSPAPKRPGGTSIPHPEFP